MNTDFYCVAKPTKLTNVLWRKKIKVRLNTLLGNLIFDLLLEQSQSVSIFFINATVGCKKSKNTTLMNLNNLIIIGRKQNKNWK